MKKDPMTELDTEVFYPCRRESETAIVAFGSKGTRRNAFTFFKTLQPVPDLSKLFVRDPMRADWCR
ncbi:MAG TPA: hypothetical protein VK471_09490 [Solirubrobacterales bacterium]|nr:hypothetical protein [Solirubrobacterales bacterium]